MAVADMIEAGAAVAKTSDGRGGERWLTAGEAFQLSQAISLKRIADALGHMTTEPCNYYGETFVPAIARAISDGMAGRV